MNLQDRTENPEIDPYTYSQLIHSKGTNAFSRESQQPTVEQLDIYMQNKEPQLISTHSSCCIQKLTLNTSQTQTKT